MDQVSSLCSDIDEIADPSAEIAVTERMKAMTDDKTDRIADHAEQEIGLTKKTKSMT
tara:strand:+ start:1014 stop:1184 length:171 start_codon:yes stop_codon:yes gene_type:complete